MELRFYTPKEVAKLLKVTVQVVYEYIKLGRLTALRLGRRYRISREDLEDFIQRSRTTSEGGQLEVLQGHEEGNANEPA